MEIPMPVQSLITAARMKVGLCTCLDCKTLRKRCEMVEEYYAKQQEPKTEKGNEK